MAAKSNFKGMVLSLGVTCLVCGVLLGFVNDKTEPMIEAKAQSNLEESIRDVLPEGGSLEPSKAGTVEGVSEYYTLSSDGTALAYAVKSTANGFGGALSLMVGVLPDGTVYNTSVLSHSETPGLGAKCTDESSHFRIQFKGFKGKLAVKKDGGDVDAITASTITSRAFTKAVAQAVEQVRAFGEDDCQYCAESSANNMEECCNE